MAEWLLPKLPEDKTEKALTGITAPADMRGGMRAMLEAGEEQEELP